MRRGLLALSGLAALLALAVVPANPSTPAGAAAALPAVTVTPTTGLVDGQKVTVTVKAAPDVRVTNGYVIQCRGGVTYAQPEAAGSANCPTGPISSSASVGGGQVFDGAGLYERASTPAGESFEYTVATGTVTWLDQNVAPPFPQRTLTCDSTSPCVLLVVLTLQQAADTTTSTVPIVVPLSFGSSDPIAACGGFAPGALSTGGSDRMFDAWIQWTLAMCRQAGSPGALSHATFLGEGAAADQLARGSLLDLAYSASGYDDTVGLAAPVDAALPDGGRRPVVAVPVALFGAGVAVGGGIRIDNLHKLQFDGVRMKPAWMAALLSGGDLGVAPYVQDIVAANAVLKSNVIANYSDLPPALARAGADTTNYLLTRYFATFAPSAWAVPKSAAFGDAAGVARPVTADLATTSPQFNEQKTGLVSGRPGFQQVVTSKAVPSGSSGGPEWFYIDQPTAAAFGLPMAAIENAQQDFVAPTAASLTAAVPTMRENQHGILVADPSAVAPKGQEQPYPLTMVEYALVPAQALLNPDCSARTASQKALQAWLTFITSDAGQSVLPAGFTALPAALRQTAAERIALVGATATTGPCAAAPAAPAPGSTAPPPVADLSVGAVPGGSSPSASTAPTRRSPTAMAPAAPTAVDQGAAGATPTTVLVAVPAYGGRNGTSSTGTVLALLGILVLTSVAAFSTAKVR